MKDPAARSLVEIDKTLEKISKKLKIIHYIEPTNSLEQKREFLKGKIKTPKFSYAEPDYDYNEVSKFLENLKIPECESTSHYKRKIHKLQIKNKIVEIRGSREVRELSLFLFHRPSEKLIYKAENLLNELENSDEEKTLSSNEVVEKIKESLKNISGWKVKYHDKHGAFVNNALQTIFINKKRKYSQNDIKRLVNHEVKVHIYRYENGRSQDSRIWGEFSEDYLVTEEGLAVYAEKVTDTLNNNCLKDYAGRVIAVDCVIKGENFKQTFERLKSYRLNNEQAWQLSLRAHRGGGFIKDHVYLQGLYEIEDYIREGGDLSLLYVGKVNSKFSPEIKNLIERGILQKPKYFPDFFRFSNKNESYFAGSSSEIKKSSAANTVV